MAGDTIVEKTNSKTAVPTPIINFTKSYRVLTAFIFVSLFVNPAFSKSIPIDQLLNLPFEDLIEVNISTRTPHTIKSIPGTVHVYTEKEIKEHGWLYLSDLVRHIPGVDVANTGSGVYLSTRGVVDKTAQGNKTVVLLDGHNLSFSSLNSPGFLSFNNQYSLAGIKQVEVLVGPGSTLHGANAFNLVIDLISKSAEDFQGTEVSFSYGDNALYNTSVTSAFKSDNWSSFISAAYYKQDKSQLSEIKVSDTPGMEVFDNSLFGENYFNNYDVHAYVDLYKKLRMGGRISNIDSGLGTFFLTTKQGRKAVKQELVYLDWSYSKSKYWSYKFKSHFKQTETDDDKFRRESAGSSNRHGSINVGSNSLVINNQVTLNATEGVTLLGGLFYEKSNQRSVNGPFISNTTPQPELTEASVRNWDNYAIYSQLEWTLFENLYTIFGARYIDSKKQYDAQILPRVGLIYSITKDRSVSFNYQRGYRPPSVLERYPTASFLKLNPNLQPEIIDTFEINLLEKFGQQNNIRTTLFYSNVTELIIRSSTGLTSPSPTVIDKNSGNLSVHGIEIDYKWIANRDFNINTIYTFTDSYDETENENTQNIVRNKINLTLNYIPKKDWHITWDNYYRHDPQTNSKNPVYMLDKADSWLLSNLTLLANNIGTPALSASFTLRNLFDIKYGHECRCGAGRPGISLVNAQERRNAVVSFRYAF